MRLNIYKYFLKTKYKNYKYFMD